RDIFSASDWRPDADERESHTLALAGAPHGRFRRPHGIAEQDVLRGVPVERGRPRAHARHAAVPGNPANRSRRGDAAAAGRVAAGEVSGATGAVAAADGAAE